MEMQQTPPPLLGMYACDADLFERVWERVGAPARPDCPVMSAAPEQPEKILPDHPEGRELPASCEETAESGDERAAKAKGGVDGQSEDDFPRPDDLPCLGRSSTVHQGQLQQYLMEELEGWQLYRHLARKVNGPHARTLAALATEKHQRARRLAAAHFLIAGVRYWPTDRLETPRFSSW